MPVQQPPQPTQFQLTGVISNDSAQYRFQVIIWSLAKMP